MVVPNQEALLSADLAAKAFEAMDEESKAGLDEVARSIREGDAETHDIIQKLIAEIGKKDTEQSKVLRDALSEMMASAADMTSEKVLQMMDAVSKANVEAGPDATVLGELTRELVGLMRDLKGNVAATLVEPATVRSSAKGPLVPLEEEPAGAEVTRMPMSFIEMVTEGMQKAFDVFAGRKDPAEARTDDERRAREQEMEKSNFQVLGEQITSAFGLLEKSLMGSWAKPVGMVIGLVGAFKTEIIDGLQSVGEAVVGGVKDGWNKIKGWTDKIWGGFGTILKSVFGSWGERVFDVMSSVKNKLIEGFENMYGAYVAVPKKIGQMLGLGPTEAEKEEMKATQRTASEALFMGKHEGVAGEVFKSAMDEGLAPSKASWFASVADTDEGEAREALSNYRAGVAAGEDPDAVLRRVREELKASRSKARASSAEPGKSSLQVVPAEQSAQARESAKQDALPAAVVDMAKELKTLWQQSAQKTDSDSKLPGQTLDTVSETNDIGMQALAAGMGGGQRSW